LTVIIEDYSALTIYTWLKKINACLVT